MKIISNSAFDSAWSTRDVEALSSSHPDIVHFREFGKSLFKGMLAVMSLIWENRKNSVVWIHQCAGHASLIPCLAGKLFNHKNVVFAVGVDSACFPEFGYGHYRKWTTRVSTRLSLKYADLICPVDSTMIGYDYTFWPTKHTRQGITAFLPNLKTPFYPINNAYDPNDWGVDKSWHDRKVDVIGVFVSKERNRSFLKGIDMLLHLAEKSPFLRFRIIGSVAKGTQVPANCEVFSNCSQGELRAHYNESKIIAQVSITEGFPNTLCEGMACGCFPIGSNVSSIPAIVSNFGLILERRDAEMFEGLVSQALCIVDSGLSKPESISQSIFERYSIQTRRSKLLEAVRMAAG